MPTVLLTGANRGLGLALARRAADEGWRVHAACRDPAGARDLGKLKGDVALHALDVTDDSAIAHLAETLAGEPIDLLLNNAGISGGWDQRFGALDRARLRHIFDVNAIAPLMMAERFADHLARGARRLVVNVTSQMGSIEGAGGGHYGYRASKAALNMIGRALARDLASRRIAVVSMHPGWVATDMGGRAAPLKPDEAARRMWTTMIGLGRDDSGRFLDLDGRALPW